MKMTKRIATSIIVLVYIVTSLLTMSTALAAKCSHSSTTHLADMERINGNIIPHYSLYHIWAGWGMISCHTAICQV